MRKSVQEKRGSVDVEYIYEGDILVMENLSTADNRILLSRSYKSDCTEETYIVNRKAVSSRSYENARVKYPDMPAARPEFDQIGAVLDEMKPLVNEQRRRQSKQPPPKPDAGKAQVNDDYCKELLSRGHSLSGDAFFKCPSPVLGTLSTKASRSIHERIAKHQPINITACDVDRVEGEPTQCRGLVVELPAESEARAALFKIANKYARNLGFDPDEDVGQRYIYIAFD